jgi:redox-sensitive bicupin YhaK (pirin superfamily)
MPVKTNEAARAVTLPNDPVRAVSSLSSPWQTSDPFLFCAYHDDAYPAGNERLGPAGSLEGRDIGQDFEGKDGWRMYHGDVVPGFPQHPHRGFETVTVVRKGTIDHFDSLGATARYGAGDTQWLTGGGGIVHSEMFPLLDRAAPNPLELFQIWLNLPRANKLVEPHFAMFWKDAISTHRHIDGTGRSTEVTVIAGQIGEVHGPPPPPKSWAARPESEVAIWTIKMAPGSQWTLPRAPAGAGRSLYFFRGSGIRIGDRAIPPASRIELSESEVAIVNGPDEGELLLLQGRPIGEPVAKYGPFVMSNPAELQQAFADYQRTGFGGWPWPSDGPVHARTEGRFARYPDGRVERAPVSGARN